MDKETISSYGFIIISSILLSILMILVSPIGELLGADTNSKTKTLLYNTGVMDDDTNGIEYGTVVVHYRHEGQAEDFLTYKTSARMNEKCYVEFPEITGYEPAIPDDVIASENTRNQIVVDSIQKDVYVTYSPITYTIKFVLNGGAGTGSFPTEYTYGSTIVLPTESNVSRAGYKFVGWFEDTGLGGDRCYSIKSTTYGNKVYYAKYALI